MFKILVVVFLAAYASAQQDESQAQILQYENLVDQFGRFEYSYQTSNGISEQAEGAGAEYQRGSYSYTSPEGTPVEISYLADENGFQPQGNVLPVPHPAVAKAIAYIQSLNSQK